MTEQCFESSESRHGFTAMNKLVLCQIFLSDYIIYIISQILLICRILLY